MNVSTVSTQDFKNRIGDYLNQVHYQNKRFQINRKDQAMAWVVDKSYVDLAETAIEYLIENEQALADTLAVHFSPLTRKSIEQARKEYLEGKIVPLASILNDEN